ncbi:SigE family RNA polymerase sigma factor [Phytohabitans flavus]|uniref:RNA polymerase sigma24 factor n=1 Tax=Phytohabitans flavus TaxID=1076124 RepID=A0A6F8XNJ2_9ACTN|nr:sigma-70 family RNA polymerase sigma factor [Phytohabitans flavus]BCB75395.1 RNA polymerase sigma24 factor [Phytohabitans flavus]
MTFEEFVDARLMAILRYAIVVAWDRHLAEDITQNVLARAQPRWDRISRTGVPELYVKRMILNEFLSWRRRREVRVVVAAGDRIESLSAPFPDPAERLADRDTMMRLIALLSPKQRAVIALRFYEDMSIDEIAELTGARPTTVRTHLARALAALREALPATILSTTGSDT